MLAATQVARIFNTLPAHAPNGVLNFIIQALLGHEELIGLVNLPPMAARGFFAVRPTRFHFLQPDDFARFHLA
jgi:hypothetical protein